MEDEGTNSSVTAYLVRVHRLINANQSLTNVEITLVLDNLRRDIIVIMSALVAGRREVVEVLHA